MPLTPTRPRLLARFREDPVVEIWRAPRPNEHLSENGLMALTASMGADWQCWLEAPTRDYIAIGRVAQFDYIR